MPWAKPSRGDRNETCSPSTRKVPPSGWTLPLRTPISVDLPAPFSPRTVCTSPGSRSKSTPASAVTWSNRFVMPWSSRRRVSDKVSALCGRRGAPGGRPVGVSAFLAADDSLDEPRPAVQQERLRQLLPGLDAQLAPAVVDRAPEGGPARFHLRLHLRDRSLHV